MPILPLPEATGRRLASTLAIPSAVMLIKELLENAIDAEATFVEVLVSPNTVDRIEVRDNGNGIHPEDFSSLGRLGHTSKLRSFDELTTIGGSSLGFRGVALASAKTVSEVSIKTRMATESVGSFLSLRGAEGAVKDGHKPAPVGTTVCVVGLFSGIPVRQRLAIKEAGKTMTKIRDMLKSYALARPRVKLQLKVLGNPSTTFSYAPLPNADFRHAASQIFGRELTSQCIFVGCPLSEQIAQHATHQSSGDGTSLVVFEGLIPMLTADTDKISRGFFFSVDSRPISSTKGTAMKLIAVFRAVFCQAIASSGSDKTVRNLFILVNLRCPLGSYDNNVEPSKDDVLFYDEQHVLSQFGKFLASNYSKSMHDFDRRLAEIPKEVSLETLRDQSCVPSEDKSTAQTVNQASSSATVDSGSAMGPAQMATDKQNTANEEQEQNTDCSWRVDMSAGDGLDSSDDDQDDDGRLSSPKNATDDNLESINTPDAHHEDNEGSGMKGTNPWTTAKLTAPRRVNELQSTKPTQAHRNESRLPPKYTIDEDSNRGDPLTLPVTEPSGSQTHPPHFHGGDIVQSEGQTRCNVPGGAYRKQISNLKATIGTASFDANQYKSGFHHTRSPSSNETHRGRQVARVRETHAYGGNSNHQAQTKLSFNRTGTQQKQRKHKIDYRHESPDILALDEPMEASAVYTRTTRQSDRHGNDVAINRKDYGNIGFESAYAHALSSQDFLPNKPLLSCGPRAAEGIGLGGNASNGREDGSSPIDKPRNDARSYLIKRQRSSARNPHKKLRRLKTDLLPLETTAEDFVTINLMLKLEVNTCNLASQLVDGDASCLDMYLMDGDSKTGLEELAGVSDLETRLKSLLPKTNDGDRGVELLLSNTQ